jgi:acyl carrier protein
MEAARLVFDKEPAVLPEQPLSQGQIERRIQHFIATTLRPGEQMSLVGLDDVLLADGLLDSLSILRLIVFIEEEFGVSVPEEAWQPEHFQTIKRLAACVQRLTAPRRPRAAPLGIARRTRIGWPTTPSE